ncbi:MAG: VCBS repeat-containing protein [Anaerolineales bacterium]|nr:VCBS repeat-containing protein [Anaerolineales bacterium]
MEPSINSFTAPLTSTVSISYDEAIDPSTVSPETFAVFGMQTGLRFGEYNVENGTISLAPDFPFMAGEVVNVSATTGTLNNNGQGPFAPTVWQFRAAGGGSGVFDDTNQSLSNGTNFAVALGDVDGDHDLDAFIGTFDPASYVWLNDGTGHFSDSGQLLVDGAMTAVEFGDLDGDGDLDAFSSGYAGNHVWINDGTGDFTRHLAPGLGTEDVALGDFDGDGDLDAVIVNGQDAPVATILLNNGNAVFTESVQALGDSTLTVAVGDVDGDYDLDVFISYYQFSGGDKIWLNDGAGGFTDSGQLLDNNYLGVEAEFGDLNGDGDLDLYVAVWDGPDHVWMNNGSGVFTLGQNLGNSDSNDVALGDLDGDGDMDAFAVNGLFEGIVVWLNNGTGVFTDSGQILDSLDTIAAALGDLDGDGDQDAMLMNNYGPGRVWVNMNPSDPAISQSVSTSLMMPGDPITYTLVFTNNGELPAPETLITDVLPVELTDVSITHSGVSIVPVGGTNYVWQIPSLAPGVGGTITISGLLSETVNNEYALINTVIIQSQSPDGNPSNNTSVTSVEINIAPELAALPDQTLLAGDTFTLTASFTDPGLLDTHTVTIQWTNTITETIILDAGVTEFSADYLYKTPGIYTVKVTVTDSDGAADTKTFTVTVEQQDYKIYLPFAIH